MKFNHIVNYKGVFYPANTEVPIDDVKAEKPVVENKPVEKVIEQPKALQETEIERLAREEKVKIDIPKYKAKSDINKLTTAEVRDLARRLKIDGYEEISGSALKKMIWNMSQENYAED